MDNNIKHFDVIKEHLRILSTMLFKGQVTEAETALYHKTTSEALDKMREVYAATVNENLSLYRRIAQAELTNSQLDRQSKMGCQTTTITLSELQRANAILFDLGYVRLPDGSYDKPEKI